MRRMMGWMAASLLVVALGGCASTASSSGTPCESCNYAYMPLNSKRTERQVWCIVDGKTVDCKKNSPECPECAKQMKK